MELEYTKRGYLKEPYKIFYLTGPPENDVTLHYHEFMKILILMKGTINYTIEGNEYELQTGDIVLVNAGELHHPKIQSPADYERIIIYLSENFFGEYQKYQLNQCFELSRKHRSHVIRFRSSKMSSTAIHALAPDRLMGLTDQSCQPFYVSGLLQKARLIEFLILLNHSISQKEVRYKNPVSHDPLIRNILTFINHNITEPLSIDRIADAVHLNRSYLMHKFKAQTGYSIKEYITEKRLYMANHLICTGESATNACYQCGFGNYSSFYRAYVKRYGYPPRHAGQQAESFFIE